MADPLPRDATPADVVDHDTLAAVRTRWQDDAARLPEIVDQPARSGRLTAPGNQQSPTGAYATLACELLKRDPIATNGQFFDVRKVTVAIRGTKADVVAALQRAGLLFNLDTVLVYPSGARFFKWWPVGGGGSLTQEEQQKAGTDVWLGTIVGEVHSVRGL